MPEPNRNIKKIVKLENGNNRLINTDDEEFASVPPAAAIMHITTDKQKVYVRLQNDAKFYFDINFFKASQVLPAAEVPFNGSINDLLKLLDTTFFFLASSTPPSTNTNFANEDLELDEDRSHDGAGFGIEFSNFRDLLFEILEGIEFQASTFIVSSDEKIQSYKEKTDLLLNSSGAIQITKKEIPLSGQVSGNANIIIHSEDFNFDEEVIIFKGILVSRRLGENGSGEIEFFSSATRNIGGGLELAGNSPRQRRRDSYGGNAQIIRHSVTGNTYNLILDPNSGVLIDTYSLILTVERHTVNTI